MLSRPRFGWRRHREDRFDNRGAVEAVSVEELPSGVSW
jgi:hypothetical protein